MLLKNKIQQKNRANEGIPVLPFQAHIVLLCLESVKGKLNRTKEFAQISITDGIKHKFFSPFDSQSVQRVIFLNRRQ